jgi:hypothetical protein
VAGWATRPGVSPHHGSAAGGPADAALTGAAIGLVVVLLAVVAVALPGWAAGRAARRGRTPPGPS